MQETVRQGVAIEVEKEGDGWHGWVYKKVKGRWVVAGAITPRPTEEAARAAVFNLSSSLFTDRPYAQLL